MNRKVGLGSCVAAGVFLMAMGAGSRLVLKMFLLKALVFGLAGGVAGWFIWQMYLFLTMVAGDVSRALGR